MANEVQDPVLDRAPDSVLSVKRCVKCSTKKPFSEFYKKTKNKRPTSACKACIRAKMRRYKSSMEGSRLDLHRKWNAAWARKWRLRNPDKSKEARSRSYAKNKNNVLSRQMKKRMNISQEMYDEMLLSQGGACAICLGGNGKKRLFVDHDHKCCSGGWKSCGLCVRGLLCHRCNMGIGMLRDNPLIIESALNYMKKWSR